ncbi:MULTISPECIES: LacI family DNA-binding transcriptional regulator [Brevibacillus]|uniref:LacI family DNA-binding transcriptional regulator n=1 Tax=Brevibacillus TaxID=55080 RepID=UPI00285FE691|nr:LacI family DNA-binding transcriptional regulator [Brevibacillus nitrificans]MDR7314724.1 LacI family transcriptional regulator [Brevibacillus nitrificans]
MKREKRRRVTLQQVAEHAGVSRATASLIVRGSSNISEATRNKVLESMRELGYVYDRVAANLRSQHSSTVGLLITEIDNPFFSELLVGVHQTLDKDGYTVILGTTFDLKSKQDTLLSTMLEYRVGGVILSPASKSAPETIEYLRKWDIPVVLVAKDIAGANSDYVGIDNVVGGKMAVDHLIQLGHRRIAFLGGPSESTAWKDRNHGYQLAHQEAGIEIDQSLWVEGPATVQGGVEVLRKVMSDPNPPTAAFCYNDVVSFGVMHGLKEAGLTPGKDLAIVGFDNIKEAAIYNPSLTTIDATPELVGAHAADLLHQRILGLEDPPKRIILKPKLVVRGSCSLHSTNSQS